jgi:phosphate transport system substrate-binding protein
MNAEQLQKCRDEGGEPLHIPLAMGAVVAVYNLDEVKQPLRFTGEVLARIYMGKEFPGKEEDKILRWNHPAIKALNPAVADQLPDKEIVVVHRSDGSGTTYVWVDYLAKVSPEWKDKVGVATSVNWPTGIGQKGNEGVAGQVQRSPRSIGYVELIYATQNDMKYALVKNKAGEFIEPNLKSIAAAADNTLTTIPDDLRYSITDAPGKDSYPISGTTWAVVYDKLPAEKKQAVVDFLRWVIHDGQQYCEELHYAPLPKGLVERADKKLDQIKVGK